MVVMCTCGGVDGSHVYLEYTGILSGSLLGVPIVAFFGQIAWRWISPL